MSPLEIDRTLIQAAPLVEHPVLTAVFVLLSAWWVKALLVALGLGWDLRLGRRVPIAAAATTAALLCASTVTEGLKHLFDRVRPPDAEPGLESLVALPGNPSFPSGHSASAFAGATVVALLCPRLRFWALGLAAAVALSRVYLRVHYPLDVVAGALVGAALGVAAALVARRLMAGKPLRPAF
jgi:membrane-associated phospholipid phosphatase